MVGSACAMLFRDFPIFASCIGKYAVPAGHGTPEKQDDCNQGYQRDDDLHLFKPQE